MAFLYDNILEEFGKRAIAQTVPFYNYANENEFKKTLEDTLKI